ncbi:hypothetical protein P8452_12767 [Trifolium repens]|nr:hypothetical protein P8452_12767 [Trifolium repens]
MLKRPPTAFIVFMLVRRLKKKPYLDRFIKVKVEYEKAMEIYNAIEKKDVASYMIYATSWKELLGQWMKLSQPKDAKI